MGERNVDQSIGFGVTRNTYSAHSKFSENTQAEKVVDRTGKHDERNSSNAQIRTSSRRRTPNSTRRIMVSAKKDFREVHQQSLTEMEELRKFQKFYIRSARKTEAHRGSEHYYGIIRQSTRTTK